MKMGRVLRDAILLALALAGLQTLQVALLKEALAKEEQAAAHRLAACAAGILNKAHRSKDDLLLSETLSSLDKAPGVILPHMEDSSGKPTGQTSSYSYVLRDGDQRWGMLNFSISDHLGRHLMRRAWMIGAAAISLLWIALFFYLQRQEKRAASLCVQVMELQGMLETEKFKRKEAEKREERGVIQCLAWLEMALAQIPRPLLLLDGRQRLAAMNTPAAVLLDATEPHDLSGKSWQDIRGLSACGPTLAESLEAPGRAIRQRDGSSGRAMEFFTMRLKEGLSGGTWVRFLEDR